MTVWRRWLSVTWPAPWHDENAIRDTVFSQDRLEQHAESLAVAQGVTRVPPRVISLRKRLSSNAEELFEAHRAIAGFVADGRALSPAAEWLLNNSHIIEEQIREIRLKLPPAYYDQLPKLADGPFAGYPRVFGLAWAYVAHTDSHFDLHLLRAYVTAYQRVQPLTIGELWALPLTLQIVLVENLRRAARRIVMSWHQRAEADQLADAFTRDIDGAHAAISKARLIDDSGAIKAAFVSQLVHRFNDWDSHLSRDWLQRELERDGLTADDLVRDEHARMGATNTTVRNIMRSMRLIPDVVWPDFMESVSCVHEVLIQHPTFSQMDFPSRNAYRSVIEALSRRSSESEKDIAERAVAMARVARSPTGDNAAAQDPGYYLFGPGLDELKRSIAFQYHWSDYPAALTQRSGLPGFLLTITFLTVSILALPLLALIGQGVSSGMVATLALLGIVPALSLSLALVNRAVTKELPPKLLPGMMLKDGVPDDARTLVVIPTLISDHATIEGLMHTLEVHHLATGDDNVFYAVASDWVDAKSPTTSKDDELLASARRAIEALNRRHPVADGAPQRFYVFHRKRQWNPAENCWMGWERKRGKLHELNRLLRDQPTSYMAEHVSGADSAVTAPRNIKFVITLDSDTRLPRDAARRLIGKMLHPLNRPIFDATTQRVVSGYGVLQPRVTPSLPEDRHASIFQRLFTAPGGIDPYAGAISDVYQDLFDEGSFAGKGIYDVDAFEAATAGRFPENSVLSHDLIEGIYARAGLASDIEVVEEFPSRYDVARGRDHRWTRGDWLLLPWLTRGHAGRDTAVTSPSVHSLSPLARWKLLDNLRRSTLPILAVVSLVVAWLLPPSAALIWTSFIVASIALPGLLGVFATVVAPDPDTSLRNHGLAALRDLRLATGQIFVELALLADRALATADAIVRALYRRYVSGKFVLEWTTAAQAKSQSINSLAGYAQLMAGSVAFAVLAFLVVIWAGHSVAVAAPLLALWLGAPVIATYISRNSSTDPAPPLTSDNRTALRLIARRTWRFFEINVGETDNFLPPDNLQEEPQPVVAHRTSPTNIGLYLLAVVSGREFGWISTVEAADRLERTLRTMGRLERCRSHFYNWYDTRTLSPLEPRYISSVDSGNLAGHMLALAARCRAWTMDDEERRTREGVHDALRLMDNELAVLAPQDTTTRGAIAALHSLAAAPNANGGENGVAPTDWSVLAMTAETLAQHLEHAISNPRAAVWAKAVADTARSFLRDEPGEFERGRLRRRLLAIADAAEHTALAMDFSFLIEPNRELLSIGFVVNTGQLDESCYDLLASEARLASLVAIAKGDLPTRHWFRLGRAILPADGQSVLTSWSGSMFEYLMPELVTLTPRESLLGLSMRTAVRQHMRNGQQNGTPWGISESAYNARDLEFTYQYSPFGVASLGLKRGLSENHVVAPYATALAALVAPNEAAANFSELQTIGAVGNFGFYEAIDYTPTRVATAGGQEIVKAYMAHHQGMTIVALANTVFDNVIARAFHTNPIIQTVDLLLQERPPRVTPKLTRRATLVRIRADDDDLELGATRRVKLETARASDCHFFGNGRLSAVVSASGAGQIKWNGLAVTRWQADPTLENLGSFIYLRDRHTGMMWSAAAQPTAIEPKDYVTTFAEDRVQITRRDGSIETVLDIVVSPVDDAICRRLSITNLGNKPRVLDVTSYEELVLGQTSSDVMHPAFSKLFTETEYRAADRCLIAKRRRRGATDPNILAASFVTCSDDQTLPVEYETDRSRFIGRGRTLASPISVLSGRPLSGTIGCVLDPVFALRQRVVVPPGGTVRLSFWTVVADHVEKLDAIIEKHRDRVAYGRCATLAWTHGLVELRHLGITAEEALVFQRVAGCLAFSERVLRAPEPLLRRGAAGYAPIWQEGISGDLPIALAYIDEVADLGLIRQLLHAYEYWRSKGLEVDLVIINDRSTSYQQDLQSALDMLLQSVTTRHRLNRDDTKGSVYLLRGDMLQPLTRAALPARAGAVFHAKRGSLAEQIDRLEITTLPPAAPRRRQADVVFETHADATSDLEFFNGYGGFARDGKEYVVVLEGGGTTPAPWVNVVANPTFGFMVSAEGAGYTWCMNSKERQLTPWSNDPVTNRPGEIFYIRDDESGELWTPTASPIRDFAAPYTAAHGQGYSRFQHHARGIEVTVEQFVATSDAVKISRLRLRNTSEKVRQLSLTGYVEWVLGSARINTAGNLTTAFDETRHTIFARNPWHHFFPNRVAFFTMSQPVSQWTADRSHFFGRRGSVDIPSALTLGTRLNASAGPGLDACAALQSRITLQPGQDIEVVALLGDGHDRADAERLVDIYRERNAASLLSETCAAWEEIAGSITIKTPDRALDILVNRWLPYQTLSSRIWARAGLYQAGGAYGFRDQLQDVMSLAVSRPDIARGHLLVAAGRQFPEGDVQHWWMTPSGHGIRTRIADSCLWLPYTAAYYVTTTGDTALFDENVAFVDGPLLQDHEHEIYFAPQISTTSASFYEHCARSIDRSLGVGDNGLALFGGGDWNDGMNRVGIGGKGESVWLSWFLIVCIRGLLPIAQARGDHERVAIWHDHMTQLTANLEANAWDGAWYRRGYFDDGSPLGSMQSAECKIDSIAQSWAVMSGVADPQRLAQSMSAVKKNLLDRDAKLAPLFAPPFDQTSSDPGYIKGYPPGIRENGGQYTHAAIWSLIAFTEMADGAATAALLSMLNPINRTTTRAECQLYRIEPYVVAADIYTVGQNRGRGGWSWYTGSAGWLYRAVIEHVLGIRKQGGNLLITPSIPQDWPQFEVTYRHGGGTLVIRVVNAAGVTRGVCAATLDGHALPIDAGCGVSVPMPMAGQSRTVELTMGVVDTVQQQAATEKAFT